MKILFISTHNFATNPRLVKEIDLAIRLGHKATVICFDFNNWSKAMNDKLRSRFERHANCIIIPGERKPFLPWLMSSLLFSVAGIGLRILPGNKYLLLLRANKRSWLLQRRLKKLRADFDWIVAHNPGSFLPAFNYATSNKISLGIDLEDYHPGETNDPVLASQLRLISKMVLPAATYISAASPLIAAYSMKDCSLPAEKAVLILNYFPAAEFQPAGTIEDSKLRLCWFSQYISFGRGLEQILPAIEKMEASVSLHVYGQLNTDFYDQFLKDIPNIVINQPLPQPLLHRELKKYDVGLALENIASNLNRELCITNKMLSYQQAGLYILASATKAQEAFMINNNGAGQLVALSTDALQHSLELLVERKAAIRAGRGERYQQASGLNWEHESKKLEQLWSGAAI